MRYIDKLIYEIAENMAKEELLKERKQTKFFVGMLLGSFVGLVFWFFIMIEVLMLV